MGSPDGVELERFLTPYQHESQHRSGGDVQQRTPEEWGGVFAAQRGHYEDCTRRVLVLVEDLLRAAGIDVIQVEARTKEVASFVEKIKRKGRTHKDPIDSITDLVGVRIITYYLEDVARVGELLSSEFEIDSENSVDKSQSLASDQFGYRSAHYVASIGASRRQLQEWAPFGAMNVEFQVRTALQHAWAAVSHKLEYKSPQDAPEILRRRLHRLSALFELADEQFSILRDESAATDVAYRADVKKGRLDVPIDASSLAAYWSLSHRTAQLRGILHGHGLETEELKPVEVERMQRDRSDVVAALRQFGLSTLADLDEFLAEKSRLDLLASALGKHSTEKDGSLDDLLTQLLIIDRDQSDTPGLPWYTAATVPQLTAARDEVAAAP